MKKIVKLLIVLTAGISLIIGCFAVTGCSKKSSAVGRFDLIREDFAKNKEKEDDEKGREHLEIPANADTIEIENETWCVVRKFNDFTQKEYSYPDMPTRSKRNYIFANDIELICNLKIDEYCLWEKFSGKLDGNNYKITSSEENGGRKALFDEIENATIQNIIIASSDGYILNTWGESFHNSLIAVYARKSVIKNCVNYFQSQTPGSKTNDYRLYAYLDGFLYSVKDSIIENCINYGDLYACSGGIVHYANNSTIFNCKNYGNLVAGAKVFGGIVSEIIGATVVESCENYGNIVSGKCGTGGVVGRPYRYQYGEMHEFLDTETGLLDQYYSENQVVRNCKNYGNIYLLRKEGEKRIESTDHDSTSDYKENIYEFGGIAGSITKVENCVNEGNFYGFENMGNNIKVNFLGGVVGAAKEVTNCENKGKIKVQKGRGNYVGDICGWLDNN